MATLLKDINGIPLPQALSTVTGLYEALLSSYGSLHTSLYDQNGNPLLTTSNPGIVTLSGTPTSGYNTAKAGVATVTTAGTPVTLGSQALGSGVTIIANPNNTGKMYVFPAAGVKANTVPLAAGDSNFLPVANISALNVDADVSGESVYWQGAV